MHRWTPWAVFFLLAVGGVVWLVSVSSAQFPSLEDSVTAGRSPEEAPRTLEVWGAVPGMANEECELGDGLPREESGRPWDLEAAIRAIEEHDHARARGALALIAWTHDVAHCPLVTDVALRHRDPDVRVAAVRALGQLSTPTIVDTLFELLHDTNQRVSTAAQRVLMRLGLPIRDPKDGHSVMIARDFLDDSRAQVIELLERRKSTQDKLLGAWKAESGVVVAEFLRTGAVRIYDAVDVRGKRKATANGWWSWGYGTAIHVMLEDLAAAHLVRLIPSEPARLVLDNRTLLRE